MDWLFELIDNRVEATHDCEDECNCNFYIDSKSVEEVTAIIRAELRKRMPKKEYEDCTAGGHDRHICVKAARSYYYREALADVTKALGLEEE
jgi:hypothetical protein